MLTLMHIANIIAEYYNNNKKSDKSADQYQEN